MLDIAMLFALVLVFLAQCTIVAELQRVRKVNQDQIERLDVLVQLVKPATVVSFETARRLRN